MSGEDLWAHLWASSDVLVVIAYLVGMLGVAWLVSAGSRDAEGYTVGNRNMPGWLIGFAVLGTFTSSITFLGVPGKSYAGNWSAFVFALTLPPAAWVATRFFVPLYRQGMRLSAYEFLEQRFGYWARAYADVCFIVLQVARVGFILLLVSKAVTPLLGWREIPTIFLLGVLVITYDVLGGIRAVIWTDVIQVIVLIGGALACLAVAMANLPGGPAQVFVDGWNTTIATGGSKFGLGPLVSWDLATETIAIMFVYGILENLRNYATDQNYVQKMLAARSNRDAAQSIWLGAIGYLPTSALFCLIGTALFVHYQTFPELLHVAGTDQVVRPDEVFPHFIRSELPKPAVGLVVAAILAAAMSTVDSSLNSASTIILADVVRRFQLRIAVAEITLLRTSTAFFGIIGTLLAAYFSTIEDARTLLDVWWQYAGAAGFGLTGIFVLAWLTPRLPVWGAVTAVFASIPVLVGLTVLRSVLSHPFHGNWVGMAGVTVMLAIGLPLGWAAAAGYIRPNPRATR